MADIRTWEGVEVNVQSAALTPLVVSAITKANPAVVSYTGTDPVNGNFLLMDVQGMRQISGSVFRAANVSSGSDTVELEGVDSTLYNTFSSGTAQVVTLGASMEIIRSLSASGGDPNFIDVSTIHDLQQRQIPGRPTAVSYSFECFWDPNDAGLKALMAASALRSKRVIQMKWPDGLFILFVGYVSAPGAPTGSGGDVVTTPVTFTINGNITVYSA
jgi:hypothetical protein